MIKNYLLVARRNLLRNKSYIIINTAGLGIALACCITAYLLVAYNIEFDNFHDDEKVANTFKIHAHLIENEGRRVQAIAAPINLPVFAANEIAGIERYARFIFGSGNIRYGDKSFAEGIAFTDSSFFDMFDFPLIKGSTKSFKDKHSAIISEEYAMKYFGDEDPVGKTLTFDFVNNKSIDATVIAVTRKIPTNSTFNFNVLLRIEHFIDYNNLDLANWGDWRDPSLFVELSSPENAPTISKQLSKYVPLRNDAKKDQKVEAYALEHFKAKFTQDDIVYAFVGLRMSFVPLLVFVSMGVMILLIACFNLTNTSIALTSKRLKEVGVRKAIGAGQGQIVSQFLLETVITIVIALVVGLLMAQFIVPAFTEMWGLPYGLRDLNSVNFFIAMVMLIFLASLLAGIYPALFNSRFKPVALLKGHVKVKGTNALTRTLVAIQFALSVIVLIAGVIFIQNSKFQEQISFGYDKDMLMTVSIQSEKEFEVLRNALAIHPKVIKTAICDTHIGGNNYQFPVGVDTGKYETRMVGVGKDYFETVGFTFVEGRPFNLNNTSDQQEAVIVNEAFLEKVNIKDPLDKVIEVHDTKRHIVGVVKNHIDNLFRSKDPEPFVYYPQMPQYFQTMLIRAEKKDLPEVQREVEKKWKELFPGKPFNSMYQDDIVLQGTKRTNSNLKQIFLFLTILGGLLSASGIFALASLNTARRTKEIGIRKALGASVGSIVHLINREFVFILITSAILGSAGGIFVTNALLDEIYAHHIAIGYASVFLCALSIFLIGYLTTSTTIFKAAQVNPVDTLRNE